MPPLSKSRARIESIILLLIIVAAVLIGWAWQPTAHAGKILILYMVLLVVFAAMAGHIITGEWRGVLIDPRNKISLSRLQMLMWTVLLLSGFLVAVLINIRRTSNPLSIRWDETLWALLGISTASLVGSPLINISKSSEKPNTAATARTMAVMADQGIDTTHVKAEGKILVNEKPEDASWTDIFKGEETGNGANLDLAKIQMFFFTVVTWSLYALALGNLLRNIAHNNNPISEFPPVDGSMVALLGISHAGYLANKAVPHTPDPPPGS
jgi:K+-sensing histidine kinase KdpD